MLYVCLNAGFLLSQSRGVGTPAIVVYTSRLCSRTGERTGRGAGERGLYGGALCEVLMHSSNVSLFRETQGKGLQYSRKVDVRCHPTVATGLIGLTHTSCLLRPASLSAGEMDRVVPSFFEWMFPSRPFSPTKERKSSPLGHTPWQPSCEQLRRQKPGRWW